MILHLAEILHEALPGRFDRRQLSVAALSATHPKFLVFDRDRSRPACVVEMGPVAQMRRHHEVLLALHARIPSLVPEPLACTQWDLGSAICVQGGLPGLPWFALRREYRGARQWQMLLEHAVRALCLFQMAARCEREWTATVHPGDALRSQARACADAGLTFDPAVISLVMRRAERLDDLGAVDSQWQHGDFSLNNLLVSPESVGIIDFDEFGETSMPLHDEFGLALSMRLSQDGACELPWSSCLGTCVRYAAERGRYDELTVEGLLLHHLLWRIRRSLASPARKGLRQSLVTMLDAFVANPGAWLKRAERSEPAERRASEASQSERRSEVSKGTSTRSVGA
jgi:Phosphotransferase enzyme family